MGRQLVRQSEALFEDLEPAQAKAIVALVSGLPVASAAKSAGVSRPTLHRWLAEDPRFVAALGSIRADLAGAARLELESLAGAAVSVIREVLTNPQAPVRVRVEAAFRILEFAFAADTGPTTVEQARKEFTHRQLQQAIGIKSCP
jgi:hypothetical protein